jgi:hypothetical protein
MDADVAFGPLASAFSRLASRPVEPIRIAAHHGGRRVS